MRAHEPWADMAALLLRTSASSGWRWGGWEPLLSQLALSPRHNPSTDLASLLPLGPSALLPRPCCFLSSAASLSREGSATPQPQLGTRLPPGAETTPRPAGVGGFPDAGCEAGLRRCDAQGGQTWKKTGGHRSGRGLAPDEESWRGLRFPRPLPRGATQVSGGQVGPKGRAVNSRGAGWSGLTGA